MASRSVGGGTAVSYKFDADGLFAGTSGLVSSSVTRDFNGPNGLLTGSTFGSVTDALTYDGFGELKTYSASFGANVVYSSSITARDGNGRITGATEALSGATHSWAFGYDQHGDLTSVTEDGATTAYVFDPNGNRLGAGGQASTYDAQDRLLTSPGATYTYTNNGELLTKVTAAGTTSYAYDLVGALRSVTLPSGDAVTYVIDGQARRVGRTWSHGGQTVKQGFLYDDQLHIAAELDGHGNVVSTFVYGLRSNVPDAMVRGGNTYRILSDWRGSVRAVVDANAGTVVQTIDYDAWGNATVTDTTCATGALCALFQPFGFAGGLFDRETGLVRFGARDYDATVGRWTLKDPTRFMGSETNLFAYADDDPVANYDMTGTETQIIVWEPVGQGGSSFGHLSVEIDGTAYSYGPGGMTVEPAAAYMQRNDFRGGQGYQLDLTPEQEQSLASGLASYNDPYSFPLNSCTAPIQELLSGGTYAYTPQGVVDFYRNEGLITGETVYPPSNPATLHGVGLGNVLLHALTGWLTPWL